MYKKYYQEFIARSRPMLHFAAHSHHFWPDVSLEAHQQYWFDSAQYVDDKWGVILGERKHSTSKIICKIIGATDPEQIVFAPNTMELVFRLLSCLDWTKNLRILSTKHEFHSFNRLARRLSELPNFNFEFAEAHELAAKAQTGNYDMVFFSRVFFDTGRVFPEWEKLVTSCPERTLLCMDDYHGFMAYPIDLGKSQHKLFYMGGSYKYAQGGEGACFMAVPKNLKLRPFFTGWFADFGHLEQETQGVGYDSSAMGMAGATMDFTAMYRLEASLKLMEKLNLSVHDIHEYIKSLQKYFLSKTRLESFVGDPSLEENGHFLSFRTPEATSLVHKLKEQNVVIDSRGPFVRFGFGLYHELSDVDALLNALKNC